MLFYLFYCVSKTSHTKCYHISCKRKKEKIYLSEITLPASLTEIGKSAFEECSSLKSITIPASVEKIDTSAFYACRSLTHVTILNPKIEINSCAFSFCSSLKRITVSHEATIASGAFPDGCYVMVQ